MPFTLKISNVKYNKNEIAVSGRLISGTYSGPEAVTLRCKDGSLRQTVVTNHSMESPIDWPIRPSHTETILTIYLDRPSKNLKIDETQPVTGVGVLLFNTNRIDISHRLNETLFWALQLDSLLQSEECEEPYQEYFGVSTEELNAYYESVFNDRFNACVWPYFRIEIGKDRYIEVESSAGIEYQDRFWIGRGEQRVILGYNSGHFSLPAFRFEEIAPLAAKAKGVDGAAALLILLTGTYRVKINAGLIGFVTKLFDKLPGKLVPAGLIAQRFAENMEVPDLKWRNDSELGWVNNGNYSQRNPESSMSLLSQDDFRFIKNFFD